jgi:hypothetical protein
MFGRFDLLTAVTVKITAFLYVIPCRLVGMYCFERPCGIHLHGRTNLHCITSQKTEILKECFHLFLLAKVKCSVANHATLLQSGISAPLTPQSDTGHDSKTFVFTFHLQFLVKSSCLMSTSHKISNFSRFPYYLQHFLTYINTHEYNCMHNLSYNPQFESPDDLDLVPGK